jgi:hypothetical protein
MTEEIVQPTREEVVQAIHGSADHPLRIGDLEITCYVLEDERRVLAQGAMISSLGLSYGGSGGAGGDRLAKFAGGKGLNPFISAELRDRTANPIKFRAPNGQINEALCKVLAHNICCLVQAIHALGIEPNFGAESQPALKLVD